MPRKSPGLYRGTVIIAQENAEKSLRREFRSPYELKCKTNKRKFRRRPEETGRESETGILNSNLRKSINCSGNQKI